MQMKLYLNILLIIAFGLSQCKNHEKAVKASPSETMTRSELKTDSITDDLYRLTVSFYSIGMGTENDFIQRFEDSIGTFSGKVNKTIDYSKNSWGREGETDFCLKLNELSEKEQLEFIQETRKLLQDAKWVHVNENAPCRHLRKG